MVNYFLTKDLNNTLCGKQSWNEDNIILSNWKLYTNYFSYIYLTQACTKHQYKLKQVKTSINLESWLLTHEKGRTIYWKAISVYLQYDTSTAADIITGWNRNSKWYTCVWNLHISHLKSSFCQSCTQWNQFNTESNYVKYTCNCLWLKSRLGVHVPSINNSTLPWTFSKFYCNFIIYHQTMLLEMLK